jgi:hypothetical protein
MTDYAKEKKVKSLNNFCFFDEPKLRSKNPFHFKEAFSAKVPAFRAY